MIHSKLYSIYKMSHSRLFFLGALFGAMVSGTIAVLCILAMRQAAAEEPERGSKKFPQEHDERDL